MGHININLVYKGEYLGKIQTFQRMYNIQKMNELVVSGEDYNIPIEIDDSIKEINWDEIAFPSLLIKGKVLEIVYYQGIRLKLEEIKSEINRCRFEDRYQLRRLGEQAIRIIANIKPCEYLVNLNIYKEDAIGAIDYTLRKEVEMMGYFKKRDSKKRKDDASDKACSQLAFDISNFLMSFEHYDPN